MKRFMKICAITAAVILGLGVILVTIGGCGGGLKAARNMAWDGAFSYGPEDFENWFGNWAWKEDWETYDPDLNDAFDNAYEVIKNKGSYTADFKAEDIKNLELGLGGCKVEIVQSADEDYHISVQKVSAFQAYVKEDTLYVTGVKTGNWTGFNVDTGMYVEIQIPAGTIFEDVDISLGAGDFNIDTLQAEEMEMEIGAGRLQAESLKAQMFLCEAGAGQVIIKDAQLGGDTELSVGAGEMRITGSFPGNLQAECGLGNMEITVTGSKEGDHNYDMECAAGNLRAGSYTVAGLAAEQYIDNGAASNYSLSCAMGNLTVTFK